jgi:hypothetical protein
MFCLEIYLAADLWKARSPVLYLLFLRILARDAEGDVGTTSDSFNKVPLKVHEASSTVYCDSKSL